MRQPRTEYVVAGGRSPFPMDMLRREFAFPARTEDALLIERSIRHTGDEGARIRLVTTALWPWQLNPARWESMGWKIVEGAE